MIDGVRKFILSGIALVAAGFLILGIWTAWLHLADPMTQLHREYGDVSAVTDSMYTVQFPSENRIYRDITLESSGMPIRITVSSPETSSGRLPVLIILGGLEIGRASLRYIEEPGNNILISYEYPYSPEYWYENPGITELSDIRQAVLEIPAQVSTLIQWTSSQSWADASRMSVLGYSFGALFLPSSLRYTQESGLTIPYSVLAYGGADIYSLLYANMKKVPEPARSMGAWILSSVIYPVEPAEHIPHLAGSFFVINGTQDDKIPESSWRQLQQHLPEPKTIHNINRAHMHPNKPELTRYLVQQSREWLLDKGAINR
ncbi:MAG: hypothetical protein K9N46_12710 [Candidatus Marinimicrobia bacterium]|nr:hypothetical protein [Candidatus Neomarinimicrobiota bacterium]MCF7827546.1 hypothetical protein [Candidatus Neomarinimicrobiota bacterium]MCF7881592.1 hypothetical protein [Candidatus Neomarinimicrobiota bacterium]